MDVTPDLLEYLLSVWEHTSLVRAYGRQLIADSNTF
jgi:hypothetical protein